MDFAEPLQSLIPGASGRVLGVLVQTSKPLSGRAIAQLAGVSAAQAARVLPKLVELGVIESQQSPPAILYSIVPEHVASEPLRALGRSASTFVEDLRHEISEMDPAPACVAAYGSFARHEARVDSDIDLLMIRPRGIGQDDEGWLATVESVRARASRLSGNRAQILEVGQAEVRGFVRSDKPFWQSIVHDAVVVYGQPLHEM